MIAKEALQGSFNYNANVQLLILTAILSCALSVGVTWLMEGLASPIFVLGAFAMFTLSYNSGIAFGIPLPEIGKELLIGVALLVIIIAAARSKLDLTSSIGFGLIIGGAAANLIDRIQDGLVTDYFLIGTFPIFNAADACISIGVGLLLLDTYMKKSPRKP